MTCTRCTGHCCRAFFLPFTVEELRAGSESKRWSPADRQVADMVIPLGSYEDLPDELKKIIPANSHDTNCKFYTCRNYDVVAGNCLVYETRPLMCRDYPYGSTCKYQGCTLQVEPVPPLKKCDGSTLKEIDDVVRSVETQLGVRGKGGRGQRMLDAVRSFLRIRWSSARRVLGRVHRQP